MKTNSLKFQSICSREWIHETKNEPHILPIYNTSAFVFENINQGIDIFQGKESGYVYSRYGNPTLATTAGKLAALESIDLESDAFALLTGSGMGAISTSLITFLKKDSTILTQKDLYGGTTEFMQKVLQRFGVDIIYSDMRDQNALKATLEAGKVDLIYLESPSNPLLRCVDLEMVSSLAKQYGVKTLVDNTFASPYLQRPLNYGFDVVIYSTTKYLNGMGNALGGAMICQDQNTYDQLWTTLKLAGPYASPNDVWLLYNGLKTFPIRMDKHCHNATTIANYLEKHPRVKKVNYPGLESHESHSIAKKQMSQFGGMLSFELDASYDQSLNFMNQLKMITLAPTLGNVDTLLLHPASSSHLKVPPEQRASIGITDGLMRLSVGIEDSGDIIGDIKKAIELI